MNQKDLAALLDKPQSSISAYEKPAGTFPPESAAKLIEHAGRSGLVLTFDHIYGQAELPTPSGWVRFDEVVLGETRPTGDGWQALYRAPAQAAQAGG